MNTAVAPSPTVTQDELNEWYALSVKVDELKAREMELRKKIFAAHFTMPVEGTNTVPLAQGWVLKGKHTISRSVDIATLTNLSAPLRDQGVDLDSLLKYKPELVLSEYRKLDGPTRELFDQILVIKVGSPALEIVLPKR